MINSKEKKNLIIICVICILCLSPAICRQNGMETSGWHAIRFNSIFVFGVRFFFPFFCLHVSLGQMRRSKRRECQTFTSSTWLSSVGWDECEWGDVRRQKRRQQDLFFLPKVFITSVSHYTWGSFIRHFFLLSLSLSASCVVDRASF